MLGFGIGLMSASRGVDVDAQAWAAAVVANSGTVSPSTLRAVSNFARSCKAAGIWTKLNRVNLFCGNQLAAALVPLKVGAGSATDTNTNFVAGDYSETTGLAGNGTSKRLATGVAENVFGLDVSLGVYIRTVPSQALAVPIGSNSTALTRTTSPYIGARLGHASLETVISGAVVPGFYVGSRLSSTNLAIYKNGAFGTSKSDPTANGTGSGTINVFCRGSGLNDRFENGTLAGYSIGTGLSAAEVSAYNTIMETFQDALGRGVQ